jgi:hypothetical protein
MTSYGKIEIMEVVGKRYEEVIFNDYLAFSGGLRRFAGDNASTSRCIHRPEGMISLSAGYLAARYELQFMEQTLTEAWIDKDHGSYSISDNPLRGTGRVVKLRRFKEPEPFSQFYYIITSSNRGHRLVWRVGITSFSKEITEEDL